MLSDRPTRDLTLRSDGSSAAPEDLDSLVMSPASRASQYVTEEFVTVNERAIFKNPVHLDDYCSRNVNTVASQQSCAWSRSYSAFPTSLSNSLSFQNQGSCIPKSPFARSYNTSLPRRRKFGCVAHIDIPHCSCLYDQHCQVDDSPITQDP